MYHFSLYTRILEGLQQKLRGLEPLSPIASAATDAYVCEVLGYLCHIVQHFIVNVRLCAIFDGNLLTNFNVIVFLWTWCIYIRLEWYIQVNRPDCDITFYP